MAEKRKWTVNEKVLSEAATLSDQIGLEPSFQSLKISKMSDFFLNENKNSTTAILLIVCNEVYQSSALAFFSILSSVTGASVFTPIMAQTEGQLIDAIKLRLELLRGRHDLIVYAAGAYHSVLGGIVCQDGPECCKPARFIDIFNDYDNVASLVVFFDLSHITEKAELGQLCIYFTKQMTRFPVYLLATGAYDNLKYQLDGQRVSRLISTIDTAARISHTNIRSLTNFVADQLDDSQPLYMLSDSTVGKLTTVKKIE